LKPILLSYVLGPLENNSYVLADPASRAAVVIDPSYESHILMENIRAQGLKIEQVWLTHAHFDHIAGVSEVSGSTVPALPVALHPADLDLYRRGGGAAEFGISFDPAPAPV
jgi:hydroxyacylglutathione hydrolase